MHYLVVAKVKDYPNVNELIIGLKRQALMISNCNLLRRKQGEINEDSPVYGEVATIFHKLAMAYLDNLHTDDDKASLYEGDKHTKKEIIQNQVQFIDNHNFCADSDNDTFVKAFGYFDFIVQGGEYDMENKNKAVKYRDVVAKYGKVDAYVLPDCECYFTKDEDTETCPFKGNDKVWVLDGLTLIDE